MIATPIKRKNTNKYQNYYRSKSGWNKTTIDISLGGHLPSQIEGLFEKKKTKTRKEKEKNPYRRGGISDRRKVFTVKILGKFENYLRKILEL